MELLSSDYFHAFQVDPHTMPTGVQNPARNEHWVKFEQVIEVGRRAVLQVPASQIAKSVLSFQVLENCHMEQRFLWNLPTLCAVGCR